MLLHVVTDYDGLLQCCYMLLPHVVTDSDMIHMWFIDDQPADAWIWLRVSGAKDPAAAERGTAGAGESTSESGPKYGLWLAMTVRTAAAALVQILDPNNKGDEILHFFLTCDAVRDVMQ